ncbi:MAG: response regulator transcription factor [bacterium]
MDKISVLLADCNVILREGLCLILERESDIEIVGEAADGKETLEKTKKLLPDVAVMDIGMPKISGLEVACQIKAHNPNIRVLVFTLCEDDEYAFDLLKKGIDGYLLKNISGPELANAIRVVHHGELVLAPSIAKRLINCYLQKPKKGKEEKELYDGLTNREIEVLKLIAQGITNKEIANQLYISVKTVDSHRANIFKKLGVRDRAQVAIYAMHKGLIAQPEQDMPN